MKNRLFLALLLTTWSFLASATCTVVPVSLEKNVRSADVIIEGEVTGVRSYWNSTRTFIYTVNTIEIKTIYKGALVKSQKECVLITEGGTVGMDRLHVSPELELQVGEKGVFLMDDFHVDLSMFETDLPMFIGSMSIQSFVKYDLINLTAHAFYKDYSSIKGDFENELLKYTEGEPVYLKNQKDKSIRPLAAPSISSFSADTVTSGTGVVLTINGSNFGASQGNGKVEFRDANFGDGRYYETRFATSIVSWSNTKIEVRVPSRAGTGNVRITNNGNESGTSTKELTVLYSHLNVGYGSSTIDSAYFDLVHVDRNGSGGYTWQFHTSFAQNTNAFNAFTRSAEEWRCKTQMNWELGGTTTTNTIARDDVNLVRFTKFSNSRLGVCYSWYSGCFSGGKVHWYVRELDIEFDSSRSWYYGTGNTPNSQFDFQSVATHELGHGCQLGHVIDNQKIMHWSIGPGQRKAVLSKSDIDGGVFVKDESLTGIPCVSAKYTAIDKDKCNLTKPNAGFSYSPEAVCPNTDITFTNESDGNPSVFAWDFGSGATPATATGVGPHTVQYSDSGTKSVQLIVLNTFGPDTITKSIVVLGATVDQPNAFTFKDEECEGTSVKYTVDEVPFATSYKWSISGGGSFNGTSNARDVIVRWTTASGPNELSVTASTNCGTSDPRTAEITVLEKSEASFTETSIGRQVSFTSTSVAATDFSWDFGDGNTSTDENPIHTYADKGIYTVSLSASNSCSDDETTESVEVNYGASVFETSLGSIRVFPNPTNKVVYFTSEGEQIQSITLVDKLGRVIQVDSKGLQQTTLNLEGYSAGLYTFEITTLDGRRYAGRLMVQN
jgi:PKD repeat protein